MVKIYTVTTGEFQIRTITAERDTSCYMWVGGTKMLKSTKSRMCFNSFIDAKRHLINKAAEGVGSAQNGLILACSIQQDVINLSDSV